MSFQSNEVYGQNITRKRKDWRVCGLHSSRFTQLPSGEQ